MFGGPVKKAGPTFKEVLANAAERQAKRAAAAAESKAEAGDASPAAPSDAPAAGGAGAAAAGDGATTTETAIFAAGCFWGVELAYQRVPGVLKTSVGYIGGTVDEPTYADVCSGRSGHTEALRIVFDPEIVTYRELISIFWERHDPTTLNKQGNDVGTQYRSAVFYTNEEQRKVAEETKESTQDYLGSTRGIGPVVTEIVNADGHKFWEAEEKHQQYLAKRGQSSAKGDTSAIRCYG